MAGSFAYDCFVTWISSPSNFYVRKVSDNEKLCNIELLIQKAVQENTLEKPNYIIVGLESNDSCYSSSDSDYDDVEVEPEINLGTYILTYSRHHSSRNQLLRGQVHDMKFDFDISWHYYVHFLDYGFSQWVHVDDIYLMPTGLGNLSPLSFKCQLDGLHPDQLFGDGWSEESKRQFREIMQGGQVIRLQCLLLLNVFKTNLVCLTANVGHAQFREWMDVKEFLLHQGHGQLMNPRTAARLNPPSSRQLAKGSNILSPSTHLTTGSISVVRLAHFIHPWSLFVHPMSVIGQDKEQLDQLDQFLKEEVTEQVWDQLQEQLSSHSFFKGQLCAFKHRGNAQRALDDRIYRVFIENFSRVHNQFRIFAVDQGWRLTCQRQDLVPLGKVSAAQFPLRMATRIKMFDCQPTDLDQGWPDNAHQAVERVLNQDLFMYLVSEEDKTALLYAKDDNTLICLNDDLAENFDWCQKDANEAEIKAIKDTAFNQVLEYDKSWKKRIKSTK